MASLHELATREKALQKLDEEYRRYRQALEAAYALAEEMMQKALQPVHAELQTMRERLETMSGTSESNPLVIAPPESASSNNQVSNMLTPLHEGSAAQSQRRGRGRKKETERETVKSRRIRWGNTDEEIRQTVFEQLKSLEDKGKEITITTIKAEVPSMMRYVYGERALFKGIGELVDEYRQARSSKKESTSIASRVIELPNRIDGVDFEGPDPDPGAGSAPVITVEREAALFTTD